MDSSEIHFLAALHFDCIDQVYRVTDNWPRSKAAPFVPFCPLTALLASYQRLEPIGARGEGQRGESIWWSRRAGGRARRVHIARFVSYYVVLCPTPSPASP